MTTHPRISLPIALSIASSAALAFAGVAIAQGPPGPKYAVVTFKAQPASVAPGGKGVLVIHMVVAPGFHVNSATPADPSLIATSFAASAAKGVRYGPAKYPKQVKVMSAGTSVLAYTGTYNITVPFTVSASGHPGKTQIGGTLTYQGCNAVSCFPPKQENIHATVTVK